jgi:hypothetical protein
MSHPDAIRTMNELRYHANAKHSSTISRMRKFRSGSCTEVAAATDQAINLRRPPLDDIAACGRRRVPQPCGTLHHMDDANIQATARSRIRPAAVARRMDACKYQRSTATHAACQQAASLPSRRFLEGRYCLAPHTKFNRRGTIASLLRSPVGKPVVHWARQTQNSAWPPGACQRLCYPAK